MAPVKRVLVLGAASGIGHACATALHEAGWHVLGGDMAEIEPGGVVAESAVFDVRDPEAVEAGLATLGPFDALVNAAGLARVAPLAEITSKGWDLLIDVNLTGAFNVLRAAIPHLTDGAAIVIISSIDSELPVSGLAHYCASKAGVEALSRSAALELGPRGIRCNVVAPGRRADAADGALRRPAGGLARVHVADPAGPARRARRRRGRRDVPRLARRPLDHRRPHPGGRRPELA